MKLRTIVDQKITGKKVLLRADFNVTLVEGKIKDDTRIRETIPTIEFLLKNNNSLVIMSHLGRPKGKMDSKFSLQPVVTQLEKYLKRKIPLINHLEDKKFAPLQDQVVMIENVRFAQGDEENKPEYAKLLARFGEIFVNDAFAVCHRSHASTVGVSKLLPSFAGLLLTKEVSILRKVLDQADKPVVCVVSGSKISDKIGLIKKQLDLAQTVLVGGGIANTFLKAKGEEIGLSLYENEAIDEARKLLFLAASKHSALIFPTDFSVLRDNKVLNLSLAEVAPMDTIMDAGRDSVKKFTEFLISAGTIVFNGTLGKYEDERFARATKELLKVASQSKALSVVGGGDTIACIENKDIAEGITHVSTGGGAMLEFMEKGSLPAIDMLYD